jgi:hypothetical protein
VALLTNRRLRQKGMLGANTSLLVRCINYGHKMFYNFCLRLERVSRDKRITLFCLSVSDAEKNRFKMFKSVWHFWQWNNLNSGKFVQFSSERNQKFQSRKLLHCLQRLEVGQEVRTGSGTEKQVWQRRYRIGFSKTNLREKAANFFQSFIQSLLQKSKREISV